MIIILQGISGTGKTSLAYAWGKFVNNDSCVASVEPSWRDKSDFLGYFNEFTKKFMIDEDRQKIAYNSKQPYKSFLRPLISAVKCRMGYTLDYVKNMGLFEFFDDLNRLQIIVNADALLQGSYSGMVDTSKIPKKNFDWCREITK